MLIPSHAFIAVRLDTTGRFDRNLDKKNFVIHCHKLKGKICNYHVEVSDDIYIHFIDFNVYPLLVVKKLSIVVTPSITLRFSLVYLLNFITCVVTLDWK